MFSEVYGLIKLGSVFHPQGAGLEILGSKCWS